MIPKNMLPRIAAILAVCLLTFLVAGCSDDDPAGPDTDAPPLPPMSTFVMDFDDFQQQDPQPAPANAKLTSSDNWIFSAVNVAVWNIVLTTVLIVPTAAFVEAFDHEPVFEDGWWNWSYNFMSGGAIHTAKLRGRIDGDQVLWEMRISKHQVYTDFLWYSGTGELDGSQGQWILYHSPANPVTFLQIDWHHDAATETGDLKYTNIIPGDAENGGYIFFGSTTSVSYDRFYDIYNKGADNLTEIEWNFSSKAGRVKDTVQFEDTAWHCWNELLQDVDCP